MMKINKTALDRMNFKNMFCNVDRNLLDELFNRADELYDSGEYEEARRQAEDVLNLAITNFGNKDDSVVQTLALLGDVYTATSEPDKAIACFEQIVNVEKSTSEVLPYVYARTLKNLGLLLYDKGNYYCALTHLTEARKLFCGIESIPCMENFEISICLAKCHLGLGQLEEALSTFIVATCTMQSVRRDDFVVMMDAMTSFSVLLMDAGHYEQADVHLEEATKLGLAHYQNVTEKLATALTHMAQLKKIAKDTDKADLINNKVLEIVKRNEAFLDFGKNVMGIEEV